MCLQRIIWNFTLSKKLVIKVIISNTKGPQLSNLDYPNPQLSELHNLKTTTTINKYSTTVHLIFKNSVQSNEWRKYKKWKTLPIKNMVSMLYSYITVGVEYLCYYTSPWGKAKDECNNNYCDICHWLISHNKALSWRGLKSCWMVWHIWMVPCFNCNIINILCCD